MWPWRWCWRHLFHQIHGMLRCNSCILGCIKSHRHLKFIELCHDLYSWIGKHWNNVMGSRISEYTNTVWGASDARFRCFYWANLPRGSYVGKVMYRGQSLLLNTLPFVEVVRQSWGWKYKLRWALPCNMCHLKFINNISIQFGSGASGCLTACEQVRVVVSSYYTGDDKACYWHPSPDPTEPELSALGTPFFYLIWGT